MDEWTDKWAKGLTKKELDSVETYTGKAYQDMNSYLRGMSKKTEYKKEIEHLKSALMKADLPKDTVVRRGVGLDGIQAMLKDTQVANTGYNKANIVGGVIQDKGFVSTSSTAKGGFANEVEMVINLPKGSKAMYVDKLSNFTGEREVLINANTKFVIEDVELNGRKMPKKIFVRAILE